MTQSSKEAYKKPENKVKRQSQKDLIFWFLMYNYPESFNYKQVANKLLIGIGSAQKRLSDLYKDGKCEIKGESNGYSMYQFGESKIKPTKTEAYRQAIFGICPMFYDRIETEVKRIIK